MNDPHVVRLTYRIEKTETVDFDKAPPLTVDRGAFRVTLDAYKAKVEMMDHFASAEEARKAIDPFLRAWELEADLRNSSERFRFVYETAEIIDRAPREPGAVLQVAKMGSSVIFGMNAVLHVSRAKWPDPPQDLEVSPDADVLWRRWWLHREEKQERLLSAAYWALTMLEEAPGLAAPERERRVSKKRRGASKMFNIDLDVLNTIGELTSTRGGADESRKAEGLTAPLSRGERQWFDAAFRALVRRVAEHAYHGGPPPKPLTMNDLPKLTP